MGVSHASNIKQGGIWGWIGILTCHRRQQRRHCGRELPCEPRKTNRRHGHLQGQEEQHMRALCSYHTQNTQSRPSGCDMRDSASDLKTNTTSHLTWQPRRSRERWRRREGSWPQGQPRGGQPSSERLRGRSARGKQQENAQYGRKPWRGGEPPPPAIETGSSNITDVVGV